MGFGFISTGILVRELGAASYGTWAALTSLLAWIQLSDFGVGYALKNRIAGATRPGQLLRTISGVFQFYALIAIVLAVMFLVAGTSLSIVRDYRAESYILYLGTILFFPLTIGTAILQGLRKNSLVGLIGLIQSMLWVVCLFIIGWTKVTLLILSGANILLILIFGIGQCAKGLKELGKPEGIASDQLFDIKNLSLAIPLWSVGVRFVVLQLSSVILFSLGTYLTYSNLSPNDAARYDILFKVFQVPLTIFNIIISVYWVEIAKAISLNDGAALKRRFIQLHFVAFGLCGASLFFSLTFCSYFVDLYTGGNIETSVSDALAFWILISVQMFAYSGAVFLNAAEKLRGQIGFSVFSASLLVPAVLFLFSTGLGLATVPLATAVLIFPSLIYCNWIAYHHVVQKHCKISL
jgi:O-antigen/teichoic acid export membrane protein